MGIKVFLADVNRLEMFLDSFAAFGSLLLLTLRKNYIKHLPFGNKGGFRNGPKLIILDLS